MKRSLEKIAGFGGGYVELVYAILLLQTYAYNNAFNFLEPVKNKNMREN